LLSLLPGSQQSNPLLAQATCVAEGAETGSLTQPQGAILLDERAASGKACIYLMMRGNQCVVFSLWLRFISLLSK
jgi:hypothetical protein